MTRSAQAGVAEDGPLGDLAGLGAYSAVVTHDPRSPIAAPWLPLSALTGSALVVRGRIAAVRSALAAAGGCGPQAVEFRVAASVTQLGIAARLIAPALGMAAVSGAVLRVEAAWWQPVLGGAFPLSLPADSAFWPDAGRDGDDALAAGIGGHVVDGPVRAVTELVAAMSVPAAVLWGNVASAVNGAASMIAAARPGLTGRAQAIGAALLRRPPLAGSYEGTPATGFRRRSCCLIYRVASASGPAFCGDCILLGRG